MTAALQHDRHGAAAGGMARKRAVVGGAAAAGPAPRAAKGAPRHLAAADIPDAQRKEVLSLAGKEIASGLGAQVLLAMLARRGKSMRQVAAESGFDVAVLSKIANGRRASGPELWTLVALAEAMGFDLRLDFEPR